MAYVNITIDQDVDISADEWWDNADKHEREEMMRLVGLEETKQPISIMEEAFQAKLKQLKDEYHTLPQSVIDVVMAI